METHAPVETIPGSVNWYGFAASIPGSGHIRYGIPCQDASLTITTPRPSLIVCDGRGSAKLSHLGALGAVAAFKRQIAIMEPFLARILDREEASLEQWDKFCRILYRTLRQVQIDLGIEHTLEPKEFDFTVALAVVGKAHIGCFQVGDGSIVLRQNGECRTAFLPEKGEFANQTHFLRLGGENRQAFQQALFPVADNTGIAVTSDGPEHMMFSLADMTPGKVFDCFFDDLAKGDLTWQDLMDYLTGREWNDDPRGADDRSVALLVPSAVIPENQANVCESDTTQPDVPSAMEPVKDDLHEQERVSLPRHVDSSSRSRRNMIAVSALVFLLAAVAISGLGYGWYQHSRLRGGEHIIQSQQIVIREHEKKITTLEHETAKLTRELRRIASENKSLREQLEDTEVDDSSHDVE